MVKKYFRILAPFNNVDQVDPLKEAGADELYCGYLNKELTKKWPAAFYVLNRRGEGSSFENYEAFKIAVKKAERNDLAVFVTLNGLYTPEQYPFLHKLVKSLDCLDGVKGLIVADLGFFLSLKDNKFKKEIHISTGGACFNSRTAKFYEKVGADRVILDRELTGKEIRRIITEKAAKIDFEIFILNGPCDFADGFCAFFHCFEMDHSPKVTEDIFYRHSYNTEQTNTGCRFYFKILQEGRFDVINSATNKRMKHSFKYDSNKGCSEGCRLCDLYDLKESPIKSLKIVGRETEKSRIVADVKLVSEVLRYLSRKNITRDSFQENCKNLMRRIKFGNKKVCTKFTCLYPVV